MWKLTIEDDEGKQTVLPLAHDEYGLGRGEGNSIRLTDRNVSRKHAQLKRNGQGWSISDPSSYNGTFVNGVRVVGDQAINGGDVIQLGDYRIELVDESKVVPAPDATAQQGALAQVPVHQRPNRLVVVVGPNPGAEYPLDREHFTIGRAEEATISINHSSVSRLHAELIALGNGRYEIIDKGSANGIRINGVELKRGILEAGDALELGDVRLRFVGAGKIFRAGMGLGVDGQAMRPMGSFDNVATSVGTPAPPPRGPSLGKLIGIGAVVGLVVIGVIIGMTRNPTTTTTNTVETPEMSAFEAQVLKEAQELVDAKDFDRAHTKLQAINDNSPVRESQPFKDIESKWADWMFSKADQLEDVAEKKRILQQIASTPSVSADQRKKAADLLHALAGPEPTSPTPNNGGGSYVPPNPGGGSFNNGSTGGATGGATPAKSAEPTATTTTTAPPPPGQFDEAAIRKGLEPRVWSGKASEADIKMLIAICRHQRDTACKDRAIAMLKQKQGG
ncbi:FHA domain-containing protein [Polyangium mundeleinium]|uniref:FHA domain-containing protein n=1 Tax=Polyangium mundeleinium TaxID=2995306 RepID=A0ABT5F345_9BACT|nr:FHA domain-containing protein [Polyangium mundeleinium]MDC0747828.1 FHA domain-containing protein [Polyangium mundeleinium]